MKSPNLKTRSPQDAVVLARGDRGVWSALEDIRSAMLAERAVGRDPKLNSITGWDAEGRLMAATEAPLLAAEYHLA